jgi:hypothetical protein
MTVFTIAEDFPKNEIEFDACFLIPKSPIKKSTAILTQSQNFTRLELF